MSTEGGIKQGIAAARSLLRYLEQGQTRWLAQLANPVPTALDPAQSSGVELIEALSRFDPMDGFVDQLSEPESTLRDEPLGIGARPRSASLPGEHRLKSTAGIAPPPRKWSTPAPSDTGHKRKGTPSNQPNSDKLATLVADHGDAAPSVFGKTPDAPPRDAGRKASNRSYISADRNAKSAGRDEPRSTSTARPLTKAQQVAAVRRALTRNKRLVEAGSEPKPNRTAGSNQPEASKKRSEPTETETGKPIASGLEPAIHETLRNAHFPEEPQRTNPAPGAGATESAARLDAPAPASHTEAENHSTRTRSPIRVDEVSASAEPGPSGQAAPNPTEPPRVHDDLAQQLADAARIHGVDLV